MTSEARDRWERGLGEEEAFWRSWLSTGGLEWPGDFAARLDPDRPLQPHLCRYLPDDGPRPVRVLDVGAGPLTSLGRRVEGRRLEVTAVDPLAPVYDRLLAETRVTPPVRTIAGEAERLTEQFGPDAFDLAFAQNCLDHAYDPTVAIEQMLAVVRPGCWVVLEHAVNEGERQRYAGLHQWNFCATEVEGRRAFVVWRPGERIDITDRLAGTGAVEADDRNGWLRVGIRKW